MKINLNKLQKSFQFALQGLKQAFIKEQNFRIELIIFALTCALGCALGLSGLEWIWVFISAFLILITELLNTALERLTDLTIDRRKNILAKQTKDIAAGAVLMAVFQAIIAGCFVFIPKILKLCQNL